MSQKTRHLYAFGPFHLDAKECLLILDGKPVPLAAKAFEALVMLVENAGHLVDKDDLMKRLWPDTFVEEANVAKHVSLLRKILSEATNGREYIETIPKRGYRFVVDVREVANAETDSPPQVLPGANLIGKKVSHYRVVEMLGGGGMGLVYKAEDLKLGRRVALKFLPEELASDPVALGRFEREARAASALNHPNICTIHGTEEHEGQSFIVMELLEGETLRELISAAAVSSQHVGDKRTPLQLDKLLDVAIQVTEGLNAAHRKGIIHRDIKPANVFVTTQGQAKILDFGLAKLGLDTTAVEVYSGGDREEEDAAHSGPLQVMLPASSDLCLTRTGVAIGTAGYMSPEQVRGEKLDARTDLFSFGMVLYEMATGQRAFTGDTAPVLREAILKHTPSPPRELNPELPSELEKIINRALEKNREARYQDASQMRADLKSITASLPGQTDKGGAKSALHRRWGVVIAAVFVLLLVATIAWFTTRQPSTRPELKQRQLTANSSENAVTGGGISPDGKYLAYTDPKGIHIKLIETGETQNVPQPKTLQSRNADWEIGPWFPDSMRFLANAHPPGTDPNTWSSQDTSIWMVSVLGGAPRKLRDNAVASSVSPDGSLISFRTNKGRLGDREIWLMGPSGEQARKLYDTGDDSALGPFLWSRDGQRVIYERIDESGETVLGRDLKGGPITTLLLPPAMKAMSEASWLPDGRLIYSVKEPEINGDTCNLWEMRIDMYTGDLIEKPRRITNWSKFCMSGKSETADGKRLAFLESADHFTVHVADLNANGTRIIHPRHFTLSDSENLAADWTVDSKALIFASNRTGRFVIYKQPLDEDTAAEPLVTDSDDFQHPRVSADGNWILYLRPPAGPSALQLVMRAPITGGPSQPVFTARFHSTILCARSPSNLCAIAEPTNDRKQLIISALDPLKARGPELTRFALDSNQDHWNLDLSRDGTRIAAIRTPRGPIYIFSLRGQVPQQIQVKGWGNLLSLNWAADGKGLFVSSGVHGGAVLLHVDLQGNVRVLWKNDGGNWTPALPSPDGRHLAIQGWTVDGNMWMIENF
jgi:serine/threonine protein kinase